jgi:hypothetical protein
MGKKSGSGINILDHISKSLVKNFNLKILKFFGHGSGSGNRRLDPEYTPK